MQKGYMKPEDFNKLFGINQSENTQSAQVNEKLSGRAQLLKSTQNSITYKNFEENRIEETHLVGEAHNQIIQADWTDEHTSGVTSNVTEAAPSISKQVTLTQSSKKTVQNLTETFNTTTHDETYNVDNIEEYTQSKTVTIPAKLEQTIQKQGSVSVNNMQKQIGTQNVNTQSYNMQFDKLNMNGPMFIQGNGFFNAPKIYIGGPAPDERIDFTLRKVANEFFPTVSGELFSADLKLPTFPTKNFIVTGKLIIEGTLNAQNVCSVNPVAFDEKGLTIDLTKTINNYYSDMQISNISNIDFPLLPNIEVEYNKGKFQFDRSIGVQLGYGKGFVEVDYKHLPQTVDVADYQDWELSITTQVTLNAKFYPIRKPPIDALTERAELFSKLFWEGLQQEYQIVQPYIPFAVPEEAPVVEGARVLPIVLRLGPMVLSATRGLAHVHN